MSRKKIVVALSGQPNCGKSTMFNAITGSTARVGNYPGITVERMEGYCRAQNYKINIIDLPGTYSLTSYSMDEIVARDVIINEKPDVVVCMLDAVALERSLYLVVQLLELEIPVVVGLNMMDDAKRKNIHIDSKALSELLQVPVVECIARRGIGKKDLINSVIDIVENKKRENIPFYISYGSDLNPALKEMIELIEKNKFLTNKYPSRWLAIKYMEEDENILQQGKENESIHNELVHIVKRVEKHTDKTLKTYPEALVADYRYGYIQSLLKHGVISREYAFKHSFSEKIDRVLTQRFFGPLIMLLVLYLLFWLTFQLGAYPQNWMQNGFDYLGQLGNSYIGNELLRSLVVSGIINGVGAVLSFAPLILIMFAMLCYLEDLGYMARVAYMLDKIFKAFGLHGASVMPFIISGGIPGGCAVPGVMASRTLRSPKERLATVLTVPFMVCGAKATVFLMLADIFFPNNKTNVMLILTIASWCAALIAAKILRSTLIRGAPTPFIMELPAYRLPTLYGIITHTWDRVWQFVKKAGTVIFAISIVIWAFMTFPQLPQKQKVYFNKMRREVVLQSKNLSKERNHAALSKIANLEQETALKHSYGGRMGVWLERVSKYVGFPWQANIALIGGFAAKEVILSTLSTAYSLGDPDNEEAISTSQGRNSTEQSGIISSSMLGRKLLTNSAWTLPMVISFLLFVLLYTPCFVTIITIAKESSWMWALLGTFASLAFTYALCVIVYQVCSVFM
jgi:ferrous iron transport protein B